MEKKETRIINGVEITLTLRYEPISYSINCNNHIEFPYGLKKDPIIPELTDNDFRYGYNKYINYIEDNKRKDEVIRLYKEVFGRVPR